MLLVLQVLAAVRSGNQAIKHQAFCSYMQRALVKAGLATVT